LADFRLRKISGCDFTKIITLGLKCPKCGEGEVITRRTKRGKMFYGCNRYPIGDFASWTLPKPKTKKPFRGRRVLIFSKLFECLMKANNLREVIEAMLTELSGVSRASEILLMLTKEISNNSWISAKKKVYTQSILFLKNRYGGI
jgi:hypothetical protein